jgi:hypothetical protein
MNETLLLWVVGWCLLALSIVMRHWRQGGVGLLFAYLLSFSTLHWLAPAFSLLPWHEGGYPELTAEGLRQSTIALCAFAVGAEVASHWFRRRHGAAVDETQSPAKAVPSSLTNAYLVSGVVMYGILTRFGSELPTINALVNTGSLLMVVAVSLKCWNGWQYGGGWRMWRWFFACAAFPIITVIAQGYLGYGFAAAVTVFAFFACFYRPRWRVVVIALTISYLGFSGYVTYMRDRRDIRAVVWARGDLSERVDRLSATLSTPELFSLYDVSHLDRVESRLNQNYLIGAAVEKLDTGLVAFAGGETMVEAIAAFVPRVIWRDKPAVAGSGELVAIYTGFRFSVGTAVGIGQVLECYVNFGTTGVVIGFLLIGGLVVLVDRSAHRRINAGDVAQFTAWYLPGLSLLNVGGSFAELTSSAGAALVVALIAKRLTPAAEPALAPGPVPLVSHVSAPGTSR